MTTTSPTPRQLTRKGQETRQRIVDAAAGLIFQQGVAHTTIEDVRAAADVSSSQLYHYFEDKTALVRAVVDHQADTMAGGQENFDFSTLEGLRVWRDFLIAAQREHHCTGGCPIGSLGGELAETDPDARAHVAEGFKRWEATIQSGLREMQARGELTPDTDPDTLALALLAALQGGLLLTQIKRDTKPLEAALDAMLELIARLSGGSEHEDNVGPLWRLTERATRSASSSNESAYLEIARARFVDQTPRQAPRPSAPFAQRAGAPL